MNRSLWWHCLGAALGAVILAAAAGIQARTERRIREIEEQAARLAVAGGRAGTGGDTEVAARGQGDRTTSLRLVERQLLPAGRGDVTGVDVSADGRTLVTASTNDRLRVFDLEAGSLRTEIRAHRRGIHCMALDPAGARIASGGPDRTVHVSSVSGAEEQRVLRGHESPVISVAWAEQAERIVSVSIHGEVKVWEASSGQELATRRGPRSGVLCVEVSRQGDEIAWVSAGGQLRVWSAWDGAKRFGMRDIQAGRVSALSIGPSLLVTASRFEPANVRVYDRESASLASVPAPLEGPVIAIALDPEGRCLATVTGSGVIQLFDPELGQELARHETDRRSIDVLRFSPGGEALVAAGAGGFVQVWSVEEGEGP